MIFTIGHTKSYQTALKMAAGDGRPLRKQGKTDDYSGGYAFLSKEDAEKRIAEEYDEDFSVFGLDADWDKDTEHRTNI